MNAVLSQESRSRQIALLEPTEDVGELVGQALQLFDSMLSIFRGSTRSSWALSPPGAADVVVVHHAEGPEQIAHWRAQGKVIVVLSTDGTHPYTDREHTLVYPFPAKQVMGLLERIDDELDGGTRLAKVHNLSLERTQHPLQLPRHAPTVPLARVRRAPTRVAEHPWTLCEAIRTVRTARNAELWLTVAGDGVPLLWIRGDGERYQCHAGIRRAIRQGTFPMNALRLSKGAPPAGNIECSGDELAWFAGYYVNPVLAPWLNAAATYRLTRWPDFGSLRARDFATTTAQLRVVAALDALPATSPGLVRRARVTREHVARTLNALSLSGLIDGDMSPAQDLLRTIYTPTESTGGLRQYFRKFRKRLRGRSTAE